MIVGKPHNQTLDTQSSGDTRSKRRQLIRRHKMRRTKKLTEHAAKQLLETLIAGIRHQTRIYARLATERTIRNRDLRTRVRSERRRFSAYPPTGSLATSPTPRTIGPAPHFGGLVSPSAEKCSRRGYVASRSEISAHTILPSPACG